MGEAEDAQRTVLPGPTVAVVGPTGVGKTALGEALAARFSGEIVSADSMQVYRGMDIGTAKPPMDARRVPYRCLDLVDPDVEYSAALYQRDARAAIDDVLARGFVPVVVGGTGLYVRAALDRMDFPRGERSDPVRERLEGLLDEIGPAELHQRLRSVDPAAAALIHPNNSRRVIRALEMLQTDERSYAEQRSAFPLRVAAYKCTYVGLTLERSALYERIEARVDGMIADGLVAEVERLVDAGYESALERVGAIGYKELVGVVQSHAPLDEAIAAIKQSSRRYAKRQLTWFRADPRIVWIDVTDLSPTEIVERAASLVESEVRIP